MSSSDSIEAFYSGHELPVTCFEVKDSRALRSSIAVTCTQQYLSLSTEAIARSFEEINETYRITENGSYSYERAMASVLSERYCCVHVTAIELRSALLSFTSKQVTGNS